MATASWFRGTWLVFIAWGVIAAMPALAESTVLPAAATVDTAEPLDVREPPFQVGDYSWLNGNNYQPSSLLSMGAFTWIAMVDVYYGYSFNRPRDHTIFPATTAPRHNEFNLNYAVLGIEATGVPNVVAKLVLQMGNYIDTITGTDITAGRGAYSGLTNLRYVQQAYVGYHLHVGHGLNLLAGIFPSYIGMESYVPQENWNYTHAYLSDFTPYYLTGAAIQYFPRANLKTELWIVNGWQSLSKFGEVPCLGWAINWRPGERLSLTQNSLTGRVDADQTRTRYYADNVLQWQYAKQPVSWIKSASLALVGDIGYETSGAAAPATTMVGATLMHRFEFSDRWSLGLRGSFVRDPQKLIALGLPAGGKLPDGSLTVGELTATLDLKPSPWLLVRLEARHDTSSIPYIAGAGGVTAPTPDGLTFAPDLRQSGDRVLVNVTARF